MKSFRFKKIDAFATPFSDGNPAAVVYPDTMADITPDEMQRIAKECKGFVSEVAYISKKDDNIWMLRYYSAEKEVEFCGHATIAAMYDLIKSNPALQHEKQIRIETAKAGLMVENKIADQDAVFIAAPDPVFKGADIKTDAIADALGTDPTEINNDLPISVINAGLDTLIVPINTLAGTLSISPDYDRLRVFCAENAIDIITIFTNETGDINNKFRTRVFAAPFGYLEDPATGSGNAALGCYLLKNNLWDGTLIRLEQNNTKDRANIIQIMASDDGENNYRVIFGGGAVIRIEGNYFLP